MSGGKGGVSPAMGITEGCVLVLIAGGVAAYENAAAAVELEKVIRQDNQRYRKNLQEYRLNSAKNYEVFQRALQEYEQRQAQAALTARTGTGPVTTMTGTAATAASTATAGTGTAGPASGTNRARTDRHVQALRSRASDPLELYRQITQTAEPLVTREWTGQAEAGQYVAEAEAVMGQETWTAEAKRRELEHIVKKLATLAAGSEQAIREAESLKQEYLNWVAKVNVLNKVLERPMVLTRPFKLETAAQEIERMQKQHDALAKAIDLMLRGGNCEGDPTAKRKEVAGTINRVMSQMGLEFLGRSERAMMESSYFKFRDSAIRASVTDTGRIAFDLVGLQGQTKQGVVADMEHFGRFYHEQLAPALAAAGVPIFLFSESLPGEEIVRYLKEGEIEITEPTTGRRRTVETLAERTVDPN